MDSSPSVLCCLTHAPRSTPLSDATDSMVVPPVLGMWMKRRPAGGPPPSRQGVGASAPRREDGMRETGARAAATATRITAVSAASAEASVARATGEADVRRCARARGASDVAPSTPPPASFAGCIRGALSPSSDAMPTAMAVARSRATRCGEGILSDARGVGPKARVRQPDATCELHPYAKTVIKGYTKKREVHHWLGVYPPVETYRAALRSVLNFSNDDDLARDRLAATPRNARARRRRHRSRRIAQDRRARGGMSSMISRWTPSSRRTTP